VIPSLGVVWIIVFVLLLAFLLNRFLFAPVLSVMQQREHAVRSARDLAQEAASKADAAAAEFDRQVKAARADIYRELDDRRRTALARRTELLAKTREEAEGSLAGATTQLKTQAQEARSRLAQEAEALGAAIAERLLGRKTP
jgi:F-type H+-transporting ATPase subunit b